MGGEYIAPFSLVLCAESSRIMHGFLQSQQLSINLWQVLQSYSVVLGSLRATLKFRHLTVCVPCCQQQPQATFPQEQPLEEVAALREVWVRYWLWFISDRGAGHVNAPSGKGLNFLPGYCTVTESQ